MSDPSELYVQVRGSASFDLFGDVLQVDRLVIPDSDTGLVAR